MKKLLNFLVIFLFLTAAVNAQQKGADEPFLTKSLTNESIREVFARTSGGGISVTGVSANEARIEVYVRPSSNRLTLSKEEIGKKLDDDYELTVTVDDNKLTAVAEPKDFNMNWKDALSISFKVFVPQSVSTDLSTSGGGIRLSNLSGTQNFKTSGGGLTLDQLSGTIMGRTSGGGITVTDTRDDIDLATSGGGIRAENCSGNIKLTTSGGSIRLSGLQGSIKASTSGGPVHGDGIRGELVARTSGGGVELSELAGSVEAHTSGGNMDVEIIELGKYVKISNSGGNIQVELPGGKGIDLNLRGNRIKVQDLNNFSGEQDEHKITGKINGGGIPVEVRTSGGISMALK